MEDWPNPDDRAVPPVVGVVVLVAITIALAAIVGITVFTIADDRGVPPTTGWSLDDSGELQHEGGDDVLCDTLYLEGDIEPDHQPACAVFDLEEGEYITAGDRGQVSQPNGTVYLIWHDVETDQRIILDQWTISP